MTMPPLMKYLPAPLLIGALGLGVLLLMSRWDGAQSARLAELDRQQSIALDQTRAVARQRRITVAASLAADREVAHQRARQAVIRDSLWLAQERAAALTGTVDSLLGTLDTAVSAPITSLLASQRDQIRHLGALLASDSTVIDTLTADRDRWHRQADTEAVLAAQWQARATANLKQAHSGCLPIIGCVSRTVVFITGAALGAVASRAIH